MNWLDPAEMRTWRAFLRAHARLMATLDEELRREHGLSLGDYEVLAHLSESDGARATMAQLASSVLLSPSALTRRVDRLVASGLVSRARGGTDARVVYAVLTDEGRRRLEEAAPAHVRGVREHFLDHLDRGQARALLDALESVASCGAGPTTTTRQRSAC